MSVEAQQSVTQEQDKKQNDKEYNFRALESKFKRELESERQERMKLQHQLEEKQTRVVEEEEDGEPYVDHKKLEKKLANFGKQTEQKTQSAIQHAVQNAIYEERKQMWIEQNADFYDVMQSNAERFLQKAPEVAKTILQMPDNFERQKLVYYNIKAMALDKPEVKQPSVQDKIDANRRNPYYQPTNIANTPYQSGGDFSEEGKKKAYEQIQKLKNNLRLGY